MSEEAPSTPPSHSPTTQRSFPEENEEENEEKNEEEKVEETKASGSTESKIVVNPRGVLKAMYDTHDDAKKQAKHLEHRFLVRGGHAGSKTIKNRYECASSVTGCPVKRLIVKEGDVFVIRDKGTHNHVDVATGKRHYLSADQRQIVSELLSGSRLAPAKL